MTKSYLELSQLPTFEERFEYLKLNGSVAHETFGSSRYLNQAFYFSKEWKEVRRKVIIRDQGCDLGIPDRPIMRDILIHHLNPITEEMLINRDPQIFSMDNLICVSKSTHNAIHYGDSSQIVPSSPTERKPGDTKLW